MRLQLAEQLCGRLERIGRKVLVADDEHVMIDESPVQPIANLRVNRPAAIETAHLCAGVIV
jgi:hypothetical protein